ncbi:hypothetical protein NDU88_001918 [Pleurodeles waltl]|uniref:Uncharacterized protein n=1 Tax=Pleurodeles waltl TaxID=8319 RepID=A0AAV7Q5C4_PLEWA|nr:hypothetical protein NDU88_001918 [Pleurodeles waltl]
MKATDAHVFKNLPLGMGQYHSKPVTDSAGIIEPESRISKADVKPLLLQPGEALSPSLPRSAIVELLSMKRALLWTQKEDYV